MKLERFFDKFEQFADAPNAVAKMRELILHLAVHGQLVEQLEGDEPASDLLSRSRAEMAKLMASGKAKREKPAASVLEEEVTFSLPHGWVWCRLVDAGQFINGLAFKPSDWGSVGRPIIRIQNLSGRNLEYNRTEGDFDPSVLVQDGDILVSWSATLDAFIWRGEEGVLNQHIFRVSPAPLADKGYIFWLLKWVIRQLAESDHAHGLVMSHINRGPFLARAIPLPPFAEQKRIVAKVDELMALCDRMEAQQQERDTRHAALARASLARFAEAPTPANLDFLFHPSYTITPADLRKSILTLAVQGKLVPQDLSDEPAKNLLSRIAAAKLRLQKEGRIGKDKVVDPVQSDDMPFDVPESWQLAKLAELTELITKGSSPKWQGISYVEEADGVLFITSENVGNYRLRKLDDLKYVDKQFNEIEPRSILKRGDVLMNLVGASIGRTAIYDLHDGANINQAVALIRLVRETEGVCAEFILHYFNSHYAIDLMLSSRVVTAQPNISLTDVREFTIPIPPLAEQRRIVAKVDQLMALVDQLETQLTASRASAEKLMAAVVAELTAQG